MVTKTTLHPEGYRIMPSISSIINQMPFTVAARKELYAHPEEVLNLSGLSGTFYDAVRNNKTVATFVTFPEPHAMALFNIKEDKLILKNSYINEQTKEYSMNEKTPAFGYFISFNKITPRSPENVDLLGQKELTIKNLKEMGFDSTWVQKTINDAHDFHDDFDAAIEYIYEQQGTILPKK